MRVQNEGTGKSSWWMLNPDAKPGIYTIGEKESNQLKDERVNLAASRILYSIKWINREVFIQFRSSESK